MTGEPMDLSGRLILISGGAGALGTAIVDTLRMFGAWVAVNDVTGVGGEDFLAADVADESAVESLFDRCVQRYGRMPDAVCCHAGMVAAHPIQEFLLDAFDAHMRVNVRGSFVLARRRGVPLDCRGCAGTSGIHHLVGAGCAVARHRPV